MAPQTLDQSGGEKVCGPDWTTKQTIKEPNELLETHHKTTLPGMVGWNLIKLAYKVFIKNYGVLCLENFDCPTGVSPLLFSQLCVYHHFKADLCNSADMAAIIFTATFYYSIYSTFLAIYCLIFDILSFINFYWIYTYIC